MSTVPDFLYHMGGVPVGSWGEAGTGEVFWLTPSGGTIESLLLKRGVPIKKIFSSLALAYAATTTGQHDVIFVTTGAHLETATLDWTKSNVHLIGVGGENVYGDWTLTGTTIYTTGTGVDYVIDVSGARNTFRNIAFNNYGNNAACLSAVRVNGYGNSFYNVHFQGLMVANQIATAGCSSLDIGKSGHYPLFAGCIIGGNEWATRTNTTQGTLLFSGTSSPPPANGRFINCQFMMRSETAACPQVYTATAHSAGRNWLFQDCTFTNFSLNYAQKLNRVFQFATPVSTSYFILKKCTAIGFTEWQTADQEEWIVTDMPIAGVGGGLGRAPTGVAGA